MAATFKEERARTNTCYVAPEGEWETLCFIKLPCSTAALVYIAI